MSGAMALVKQMLGELSEASDGGDLEDCSAAGVGGTGHSGGAAAEVDQADLRDELIIEELFLDQNVAISVAEMIAEQEAWGNTVVEIGVFSTLPDAMLAAIIANEDGVASVAEVVAFCIRCRWLRKSSGQPKIDSAASYSSLQAFEEAVTAHLGADKQLFQSQANAGCQGFGPGSRAYVPQQCAVQFPRRLQMTRLWFELTQSALKGRASRLAKISGCEPRKKISGDRAKSQENTRRKRLREEVIITATLLPRLCNALQFLMAKDGAHVFCEAVDQELVPQYLEIIDSPMGASNYVIISNFMSLLESGLLRVRPWHM
eukprot:SAG11_NODE_525_length_8746_cov_5.157974_3_plen_317_part_00